MFLSFLFASLVLVLIFTHGLIYCLDCALLFDSCFLFFFFWSSLFFPFFSLYVCVSLGVLSCWVLLSSLLFVVLSSVQCGLWSPGAIVRGHTWTTEVGELGPGLWTTRRTLVPMEHKLRTALLKASISTLGPSLPNSYWAPVSDTTITNIQQQQNRNTTLPTRRQAAQSHNIQRHQKHTTWTWYCPSERQDPALPPEHGNKFPQPWNFQARYWSKSTHRR